MRRGFILLGLIPSPLAPRLAQGGNYDTYGGWLQLREDKTGFFHVGKLSGRW